MCHPAADSRVWMSRKPHRPPLVSHITDAHVTLAVFPQPRGRDPSEHCSAHSGTPFLRKEKTPQSLPLQAPAMGFQEESIQVTLFPSTKKVTSCSG